MPAAAQASTFFSLRYPLSANKRLVRPNPTVRLCFDGVVDGKSPAGNRSVRVACQEYDLVRIKTLDNVGRMRCSKTLSSSANKIARNPPLCVRNLWLLHCKDHILFAQFGNKRKQREHKSIEGACTNLMERYRLLIFRQLTKKFSILRRCSLG